MTDDVVTKWSWVGVTLELRGVSAPTPEDYAELAPVLAALGDFARKHRYDDEEIDR